MIQKIIIVGAGECGVRAAQALRGNDYNDVIILTGEKSLYPYERAATVEADTHFGRRTNA